MSWQMMEDDMERREERRIVNELINDDPDFWREIGLKRERKPKTSDGADQAQPTCSALSADKQRHDGCPWPTERHQPIQDRGQA
jgi:hypothetical protein